MRADPRGRDAPRRFIGHDAVVPWVAPRMGKPAMPCRSSPMTATGGACAVRQPGRAGRGSARNPLRRMIRGGAGIRQLATARVKVRTGDRGVRIVAPLWATAARADVRSTAAPAAMRIGGRGGAGGNATGHQWARVFSGSGVERGSADPRRREAGVSDRLVASCVGGARAVRTQWRDGVGSGQSRPGWREVCRSSVGSGVLRGVAWAGQRSGPVKAARRSARGGCVGAARDAADSAGRVRGMRAWIADQLARRTPAARAGIRPGRSGRACGR